MTDLTHPTPSTRHVLFICTGNSARSILAEALMNHLGAPRFQAHSAGSHPTGSVNPFALATLATLGIAADGVRSKNWDEFAEDSAEDSAQAGAPTFDFIFTVCDNAAGEVCPFWPGHPVTAHWGLPDPAAVTGSDHDKARAFLDVAVTLKRRIELLLALPAQALTGLSAQHDLTRIGQS